MLVMKRTPMITQLVVVVLMSLAASYAFQHTRIAFQVDGFSFHIYLVYAVTVFLVFICFNSFNRYIALAFSIALSVVALSPIRLDAIGFFVSATPLLATLMGITSVLIVPSARGRGYFEFVGVLIMPAVFAESRIGGSLRLLATTESVGYYELSLIVVAVVGGYFFLRYSNLASLSLLKLSSKGADQRDVVEVNLWCNRMIALVVTGAVGTAAVLMMSVPIVAGALRLTVVALPLYVLALAAVAGIAMMSVLYFLSFSREESN